MKQCYYCGRMVSKAINAGEFKSTRDHLTPKIRGGSRKKENIVTACYGCNQDKGRLTLEEYRIVMAFRLGHIKRQAAAMFKFYGEMPTE